jgi:cell division protein FtsX
MSRQFRQQIEGLLKPETDNVQRRSRGAVDSRSSTAEPLNVATPEDIAQVRDKLDEQNELLRAILASTVDTQTDARSTAQNSRTFAWAGTAIALLTLIATVLSIVAAINAS